jgi:hypothetical protein
MLLSSKIKFLQTLEKSVSLPYPSGMSLLNSNSCTIRNIYSFQKTPYLEEKLTYSN